MILRTFGIRRGSTVPQCRAGFCMMNRNSLDSQVTGNKRPLYPKVNHYWFKVADNYVWAWVDTLLYWGTRTLSVLLDLFLQSTPAVLLTGVAHLELIC